MVLVSAAFSRTLRALERDSFRATRVMLAVALMLLAAWAVWFFFAPISLYAVTGTARLEVNREAYVVEASVSGPLVSRVAQLGAQVSQGDVLFEIEAEHVRIEIEERERERRGLQTELQTIQKQIQAEQQALGQARQAEGSAADEARSRVDEAEAAARFAEEQAARVIRMHEQGLVSESERKRATAEAEQKRAAASAARQSLTRQGLDRRLGQSEKQAALAELEREAAQIASKLSVVEAVLTRLQHELGEHTIRAPTSGKLGDVKSLQVGAVVQRGDRLASVIPPGDVRIVGEFEPPDAVGRVRPGQKARLRLEGFSWVQYGSLPATVTEVANETRDGKIRVELAVDRTTAFPIPLLHGMPGVLEVEVERVPPVSLVLRAAGRAVSHPTSNETR